MFAKQERIKTSDYESKFALHNLVKEHGQFVRLVEKLCWPKGKNDTIKCGGFYCFLESTHNLYDPSIFLYVGRTNNLHKRFCEHKYNWLANYICSNSRSEIWWGYILENTLHDIGISVAELENLAWQHEVELGLVRGNVLVKEFDHEIQS